MACRPYCQILLFSHLADGHVVDVVYILFEVVEHFFLVLLIVLLKLAYAGSQLHLLIIRDGGYIGLTTCYLDLLIHHDLAVDVPRVVIL